MAVSGTINVTFDETAMRPLLKTVLEKSGTTMTDTQLDDLLKLLESYGTDLPVDETLQLVRENGAWKICQDAPPRRRRADRASGDRTHLERLFSFAAFG